MIYIDTTFIILSEITHSEYLTFFPLIHISENLKFRNTLNSNFQLKFQMENVQFPFFKAMLIHIDTTFRNTQ